MGRLFGTDGVRGVANKDLTPELAFKLARAGARVLLRARHGGGKGWSAPGAPDDGEKKPVVLIGRDTRVSGDMLEAAMTAGFTSAGVDVWSLGILPTPGVAYLTRTLPAAAGVMISASHNPVADNGIKFFSNDGFKLPDEVEDEIERELTAERQTDGGSTGYRPTGTAVGRRFVREDLVERYERFLAATAGARVSGVNDGRDEGQAPFSGVRIVLDCAYGAAWSVAPRVFARLGASVFTINAEPDGARINVGCGSTHPEELQKAVREQKADLGLAFDGDADRVIAVDEHGEIADGDRILAICGLDLLERGQLRGGRIAVTVYSNLGLLEALRKRGADAVITKNGDRYVLEAMRDQGLVLGGEQSGHIIFLEHNTTGDGILTGVQLVAAVRRGGGTLSQAAGVMRRFPQVLVNVRVRENSTTAWESSAAVSEAIGRAQSLLGDKGRLLVRASGTEPLIRVMGEGPEEVVVKQAVESVADAIHREFGL